MTDRINRLTTMATQIRRDVVNTVFAAGDGHPGPCMSIADIVTALYFDIMRVKPDDPEWKERDRFILSKGHACPTLYAALARSGFFKPAELKTLRAMNSRLQGHPVMQKAPGVDATTGSLGHGLSQGCGMALAARRARTDSLTFVLTGDGELNEGIVWEAAMAISNFKLTNLIAIVDNNGHQSSGKIEKVSGLYPLREKWEAFGWYAVDLDGHNMEQIIDALEKAAIRGRAPFDQREGMSIITGQAPPKPDQPIVFIAHTVKGKGVHFMEDNNAWHKKVPTNEEHQLAMSILGGLDLE